MSFKNLYIHLVWSTKNRVPFLHSLEIRSKVWHHIQQNAKQKNIYVDSIGGHQDHCHCLVSLEVDQSVSKVAQLLKGESSHWINKTSLIGRKFEWQDEYFAVSVSKSMVDEVRNYIMNQEEHHRTKTFKEEYERLLIVCDSKPMG